MAYATTNTHSIAWHVHTHIHPFVAYSVYYTVHTQCTQHTSSGQCTSASAMPVALFIQLRLLLVGARAFAPETMKSTAPNTRCQATITYKRMNNYY